MHLKNYYKQSSKVAKAAINAVSDDIVDIAHYVGEIMANDGVIQLFGLNHDLALSMELGFRAGGLVQYHQMGIKDLLLRGIVSEEEANAEDFLDTPGLVNKLWDAYYIDYSDAFMIYAAADVHRLTVDLARLAKARNHKVIVITSKEAILANNEENAKALLEFADKVIDLKIPHPDLGYEVDGVKVTQIANLIATLFAQGMTMEIYNYLKANDIEPGVLWSMNIKGADEHNKNLTDKFEGRWNA